MCHSARCGCYFGGDCYDGPQSRGDILKKIQKLEDFMADVSMNPDSRQVMLGRVAAMKFSAYRTKKAVKKQFDLSIKSPEVLTAFGRGYFAGLRWVLGY